MKELTRRDMNRKMYRHDFDDWPTESDIPSGYVWADRLIDIGEEVLIWTGPRGKKDWVKVIARPVHDWWRQQEHHDQSETDCPDVFLGGFSFEDPTHPDGAGKLDYHSALRIRDKWVEDGSPPHGGQHVIIGLHDPNPHVVIRDTGEKKIKLGEIGKGLGYYPITQEELRDHHKPNQTTKE